MNKWVTSQLSFSLSLVKRNRHSPLYWPQFILIFIPKLRFLTLCCRGCVVGLLLNKAWESNYSVLPCESSSGRLEGYHRISRQLWPFFIIVYYESFFVLARHSNFPTPVVVASTLSARRPPPSLSHPVTPPASPFSLPQSGSSVVRLAEGAGGRDLAIVGLFFFFF